MWLLGFRETHLNKAKADVYIFVKETNNTETAFILVSVHADYIRGECNFSSFTYRKIIILSITKS